MCRPWRRRQDSIHEPFSPSGHYLHEVRTSDYLSQDGGRTARTLPQLARIGEEFGIACFSGGAPEGPTCCSKSAPESSTTPSPTTTGAGTPDSPTTPITRRWPRSLPQFVPLSDTERQRLSKTFAP